MFYNSFTGVESCANYVVVVITIVVIVVVVAVVAGEFVVIVIVGVSVVVQVVFVKSIVTEVTLIQVVVVVVEIVVAVVVVFIGVLACHYFSSPALVIWVRGRLDGSDPGISREGEGAANSNDESTTAAWSAAGEGSR